MYIAIIRVWLHWSLYIFYANQKKKISKPKICNLKNQSEPRGMQTNLDNRNANKCFAHARRVRNQEASLVSKCSQFFTKSQQYTGRSTWPYT